MHWITHDRLSTCSGMATSAHVGPQRRCPFRSLTWKAGEQLNGGKALASLAKEHLYSQDGGEGPPRDSDTFNTVRKEAPGIRCPFKTLFRNVEKEPGEISTAGPEENSGLQQPFSHPPIALDEKGPKGSGRKCPLGFDIHLANQLDVMYCAVCNSLLHDCVVLGCGDRCCRFCAERISACNTCGKEVLSMERDPQMQGQPLSIFR